MPALRTGQMEETADAIIIGSGAAGATCARVLAEAGWDVVIFEEGPRYSLPERGPEILPLMERIFRDGGATLLEGRSYIASLQGRCVGGSTTINSAIMWRLPQSVYASWVERDPALKTRMPYEELMACFQQIEEELGIQEQPESVQGRHNLLMKEGAEALGYEGRLIPRAAPTCEGLGRCLQGCPRGNKWSMDRSYVPLAESLGARLYPNLRVDRILVEGVCAAGVRGTALHPETREPVGSMTAFARKAVIVAASAIQTPALLMRSGIGSSSGLLGQRFQAHPGAAMAARFPDPVRMWEGVTQGYEIDHFREQGFKLEAIGLPPELGAVRIPGLGGPWSDRIEALDRISLMACLARMEAHGTVTTRGRRAKVNYTPAERDMKKLRTALKEAAKVFVAAGATHVMPGIHGLPKELSKDDLDKIDEAPLDPQCYNMLATHLFGAATMHTDPRHGVVGPDLQSHDIRRLYVTDSSVFPTNLGVNPQHSIMAIAMHGAKQLAAG